MSTENDIICSGSGICGFSYKNIPWREDYYRLMMEQVRVDFSGDKDVYSCYANRGRTKYHTMLLFFEPTLYNYSYTIPFETYFPGVFDLMNTVRRTDGIVYGAGKASSLKNNNLPVILQRLEAVIVLDTICKKIHQDHPEILLLTIHDSIITTKQDSAAVEEYMHDILYQTVGSEPGLKVEELHPDNVFDGFDDFIEEEWTEMQKALKQRTRRGKKVSGPLVQEMLANFRSMASEPLKRSIPVVNGRPILSTKYVPDKMD